MEGILVYDYSSERYQLRTGLEDYTDGFHCGDGLEVYVKDKWIPTRFEHNGDWYLVGVEGLSLNGLKARI